MLVRINNYIYAYNIFHLIKPFLIVEVLYACAVHAPAPITWRKRWLKWLRQVELKPKLYVVFVVTSDDDFYSTDHSGNFWVTFYQNYHFANDDQAAI
jgi:hypothetical protein